MSSSYFFSNVVKQEINANFIDSLEEYSLLNTRQVYLINSPLGENRYQYEYQGAIVVLIPDSCIVFVDLAGDEDSFNDYVDEFTEDIGYISDKFRYVDIIGRPKKWNSIIKKYVYDRRSFDVSEFVNTYSLKAIDDKKKCNLIISLLTGSINDVERVKASLPDSLLDKIKQKIILFDGDQTRFVYSDADKKVIKIQGMSGTGKTELLLHKMKDLFLKNDNTKILFTCHNKILAKDLRQRIPRFFDFMKVAKQIAWDDKFLCVHAWGSRVDKYSGAYRYLCEHYGIEYHQYSRSWSFDRVCEDALCQIEKIIGKFDEKRRFAFDYVFIDESQDFQESFIKLCSFVTRDNVYVAGDIFQSIFNINSIKEIAPDHLLSKCYRTDPRTLMFSHALAMGLFEEDKLNWLLDEEWRACGYNIERNNNKFYLKREPLRRFEDLQDAGLKCVEVEDICINDLLGIGDFIIQLIKNIVEDNPTVGPDDIGVIFLDSGNESYALADILEESIVDVFGWEVNKAYESKEKMPNALLISNKNNVKGLEFPFVICVTSKINKNYSYRNTLYTMMTRSFLKSILVVTNGLGKSLASCIQKGLDDIYDNGFVEVDEPEEDEKTRLRTKIKIKDKQLSQYDIFYQICDDMGIKREKRQVLFESCHPIIGDTQDEVIIKRWINANASFLG